MKLTIIVLLLSTALVPAQTKKVDVKLDWQSPPGLESNGVYNIRYLAEGSLTTDWKTWPVLATVTNSISHLIYNVWETQLFAITHTNPITGTESAQDISPVLMQTYARTNDIPVSRDLEPAPTDIKQSLQIWWNGPTNWQANGGMFNVRCSGPGSDISSYLTWPIVARITNILNTKFFNVNPTQYYSISFTNKLTGEESNLGISPVRAQYNWQGLTNTTVRAEREYKGWNIVRSR